MSYFEGMTLAEIGEAYGMTESRICQIRHDAEALLKRRLLSNLAYKALDRRAA